MMNAFEDKKTVVPIDFSEESKRALKEAIGMGVAPHNIYAIYVAPELSVVEPGVIWDAVDDASRIERLRQEFRKEWPDPQHQDLHFTAIIGDPGHEIARYAEEIEADMIVMSSHGRRGFSRLLLGSVAERVLRLAACPVLVLKPPKS